MANYCNRCTVELTTENWYQSNDKKRKGRRNSYICISCSKKLRKKCILKNEEKYREMNRIWLRNNKDIRRNWEIKYSKEPKHIYYIIKTRLKKLGIVYNVTREEFIEWYISQLKICCYCDIKEEDILKFGYYPKVRRLTIDRKDSNLSYDLDNIVLACQVCNATKSHVFTYEEMKEIGHKYVKPKWQNILSKSMQEI